MSAVRAPGNGDEFKERVRRNILCNAMCKFSCQKFSRTLKERIAFLTHDDVQSFEEENDLGAWALGEYFIRFVRLGSI